MTTQPRKPPKSTPQTPGVGDAPPTADLAARETSTPAQDNFLEALTPVTEARTGTGAKAKSLNDGHRARLRDRLEVAGPDALPDYELIELILCRAFSRIDTKPIAKRLINEFKTFAEVINASPGRLKEIEGVGDRAVEELKLIRVAAQRLLKGAIVARPILGSWNAVLDHCRGMHAYDDKESFRILFLDKRNQLIADELQGSGTVDHTPVYVREVIKRALELSSTSIILVHNHPSGDPSPSRADVDMTKLIMAAGKPLSVTVHDHIIVGRQGHSSLRALGLM
jgi:DNA repair protein RadC